MNFKFAIPSPVLQPYIKQYWAIENVMDKGKIHTQRIIATGLPEFTFYFGNKPKSDKRKIEGNSLINGQQNDFYDLLIIDNPAVFSVTFQPSGLSRFLKIPMNELKNQTIFLGNLDKYFLPNLEEKLSEAVNFQQRIEISENYFKKLLIHHNNSTDDERMLQSVHLIKAHQGNISIDFLASEVCLGRKQFERKFLSHIGISPKQFLKIIRFQNAIHIKQIKSKISLTELAYEAGYYDQSHFINEVKELTGQTPKKFFENETIVSDFF